MKIPPDKIYAMIVAGTLYADTKQHEVFNKPYAEYIRKDSLWKPSEEQMKAIDFARRVLFETYPSKHNGCEPYHILGELYDQLKQLKDGTNTND